MAECGESWTAGGGGLLFLGFVIEGVCVLKKLLEVEGWKRRIWFYQLAVVDVGHVDDIDLPAAWDLATYLGL